MHIFYSFFLTLARFECVSEGRIALSDVCIGCGDLEVVTIHPLFHGGYCKICKVRRDDSREGMHDAIEWMDDTREGIKGRSLEGRGVVEMRENARRKGGKQGGGGGKGGVCMECQVMHVFLSISSCLSGSLHGVCLPV